MTEENILLNNKHILLHDNEEFIQSKEFNYIKKNFCGRVLEITNIIIDNCPPYTIIYICGDIEKNINIIPNAGDQIVISVIKELSKNYCNTQKKYQLITLGEVPINIHNTGVYFRKFFGTGKDYYGSIINEHQFQSLTESNKPGHAFRKGIYLTNIKEDNEEIKFNLLRCSTNLSGPSDNFRDTDKEIIGKINGTSKYFFKDEVELNHVLAQTYENSIVINKEKKAKISKHSDKTKDMPKNALIAFCSFYKDFSDDVFNKELKCKKSTVDPYDYCYNDTSVLTRLRFCLKNNAIAKKMERQFDITLYPNSVFIIPLSTNRLYTHEIIPSILPVDKIPTRMGYVVRCSNTNAVFKDGQTYIHQEGKYIKLNEPIDEDVRRLKELYLKENATIEVVHYDGFYFSLNKGDYKKPIV